MTELAWHFVGADRRLRDGSPLVVGEWLEYSGPLVLCQSGLHASTRAIDALQYAHGPIACLVEVGGTIVRGTDKLVCSRRRPLWAIDATHALRLFARQCALDVAHLWDMPPVVRGYLETGDESKMDAARDAARAAEHVAARAAASGTAWAAAWYAAMGTAWSAAWYAARTAAWGRQNADLEPLLIAEAMDLGEEMPDEDID